MKNAGVKIVDMGSVAVNNVADFLQQAAQQNFHPDALISAPAYDAQLLELVGNADRLIAPSDPRTRQGSHCVVVAGVRNGQWVRIHPAAGFDCSGVYHSVPLSELK